MENQFVDGSVHFTVHFNEFANSQATQEDKLGGEVKSRKKRRINVRKVNVATYLAILSRLSYFIEFAGRTEFCSV